MKKLPLILVFFWFITQIVIGQTSISYEAALDSALQQHSLLKAKDASIEQYQWSEKTATQLPPIEVGLQYGQINSLYYDHLFSLRQGFALPKYYHKQKQWLQSQTNLIQTEKQILQKEIEQEVGLKYLDMQYSLAELQVLQQFDSLWKVLAFLQEKRQQTGEVALLEKTLTQTQQKKANFQFLQAEQTWLLTQQKFSRTLHSNQKFIPTKSLTQRENIKFLNEAYQPPLEVGLQKLRYQHSLLEYQVAQTKKYPMFSLTLNNMSLRGYQQYEDRNFYFDARKRFTSVLLGIELPIFQRHKFVLQSLVAQSKKEEQLITYEKNQWAERYEEKQYLLKKEALALEYYETQALTQAELLLKQAQFQWKNGQINLSELITIFQESLQIKQEYLKTLYNYHHILQQLKYFQQP